MTYESRKKKKSTFVVDNDVTDSSLFDFIKGGINKRTNWSNLLDKISDVYGLSARIFDTEADMVASNIRQGEHAIVVENYYGLYEIGSLSPNTWDVTLDSGFIATLKTNLDLPELESYDDFRKLKSSAIPDGAVLKVIGEGITGDFPVTSGTVTDNGGTRIVFDDDPNRYAEREWTGTVKAVWFDLAIDGTDDSVPLQKAIDLVGTYGSVELPVGTICCNIDVDCNLYGQGSRETILKAATTARAVIRLEGGDSLWAWRTIKNLGIDGDSTQAHGIEFGSHPPYQLEGRWKFDTIWIQECNYGVRKTGGNIGNSFVNCGFHQNNFAYHATGIETPIMHAGNDDFVKCELHSSRFAAIYIDSPTGNTGQTVFNETIIENNTGFGVFIKEYANSYTPISLNDTWFEANGSDSNIVIDGVNYPTPTDIWAIDCTQMYLTRCNVYKITANNSTIVTDKCQLFDQSVCTEINTSASIIHIDPYTDGSKIGQFVDGITGFTRDTGGAADVFVTKPKSIISHAGNGGYSVIASNDFNNEEDYAWNGSSVRNGKSTPDGLIFDSCCEITAQNGDTIFSTSAGGTITSGRYIVWSVDMKPTTPDICVVEIAQVVKGAANLDDYLEQNKWTSLSGMAQVSSTGSVALQLRNTTGSNSTFRVSAFQVVEFINKREALAFYRSNFYLTNKLPRVFWGEAAPTTGTWSVADKCYNTAPSIDGNNMVLDHWVCTAAGTPGTWTSQYLSSVSPAT